jgi:2-keto-3-deoxy-L-arabinonate dehydratase
MVGYMGLNLPSDYERHVTGVMPTVSVGRLFVHLWELLEGQPAAARSFHQTMLPLLNFMMQSVEQLVAVEKSLLTRRGVLESAYCRAPRWDLDAYQLRELDRLCLAHAEWLPATIEWAK